MRAGFVRAERRNSGKLFCKFFARFRREVCVISTPDARLFGCQRNHDFLKSFEDVMRVAAQAGRVHEFFLCARRAEIFQKFCNSYGAILSTPNARNFANFMLRNVDSVNPSDVSLNMRSARCLDPRTFCAPRAGFPIFLKFLIFFA